MKRAFIILLIFVISATMVGAQEPDYSSLTKQNHPRLFLKDSDIKAMRRQIANGSNPYLESLHQQMMKTADTKGLVADSLSFNPETAEVTLLSTMRLALTRIVSDAYAYRFTKDKSYLKHVEMDINTVCDKMAYWNSQYDLERAEIALAMAIAYDWLYQSLKPQTLQRMLDFVQEEVFQKLENARFYSMTNNWNLVLNCSISCAALSTYEEWPDKARGLIEKSVRSNPLGMKTIYAPDGASPEGPGYWSYATCFEGAFLMALEDCLGTDFGLSNSEGFNKALRYRAFTINGAGLYYNYADCNTRATVSPGAWYCAWKFSDPSMLSWEVNMLSKDKYVGNRVLFLAIASAYRLGKFTCIEPTEHVFRAEGEVPVAVLRRGWGEEDAYLGIKGGSAKASHAHMDQGSFVFDAEGVRWVAEYPHEAYENYRRMLTKVGAGSSLFNFSQESWRWKLFAYSPRQHSTLTIQDELLDVSGFARILDAGENDGTLSASVDLSEVYFGKLKNYTRTVSIAGDDRLVVTDQFDVGEDDLNLRWSFVSMATPSITPEGILLNYKGKKRMFLAEGAALEYSIWPNDPAQYDSPTGIYEKKQKGFYIAGYTLSVHAGENIKLVTTIMRTK